MYITTNHSYNYKWLVVILLEYENKNITLIMTKKTDFLNLETIKKIKFVRPQTKNI